MRMKDKTVMNRLPSSVTSQRGMLSKKPTLSMVSTISWGMVTLAEAIPPTLDMTDWAMPPQMEKMVVITSIAEPTATFAATKRIRCRRANSGRWKSLKLAALWNIPIAKKSTNRP